MSTEKINQGNGGKIIVGVVIAALFSVVIFLFIQNRNLNDKTVKGDKEISSLGDEITDLESEIDDYKVEIENKDLSIEEKEALIAEKEKELVAKQNRINQLLASNKISTEKAASLQHRIEMYEYYLGERQKEVDVLKVRVASLEGTVDTLHGTINNLTVQKDRLDNENRKLGLTVDAAKILDAVDFAFFEVKESGKENQESEFKAGRIEKMRISFKTLKNVAAVKEEKTYYLTLFAPNGTEIKDASGSGYFTFEQADKVFTLKDNWNLDGTDQIHSVVFKRPSNYVFTKGRHIVRIFCEGYEIGSGSFNVK